MSPAVHHKIFKSSLSSWEDMCSQADAFATQQGPENLISISHSSDSGQGVIVVWYWSGRRS